MKSFNRGCLKYLSPLFFLLFAFGPGFGQEPAEVKVSTNKVILDQKVYYLHVVKPGQTLYSISRAYKVREKDIALENPGVYSGLQIGQLLKIPAELPEYAEQELQQNKPDTLRFFPHYLSEGETIYSLSRTYNVPVSEIEAANPDLDYSDLSIGQLILVPRHSISEEPQDYILHKVRRRETLYSLSRKYDVSQEQIRQLNPSVAMEGLKNGQTIKIPRFTVKKEVAEVIRDEEFTTDSLTGTVQVEGLIDSAFSDQFEPVEMESYIFQMKNFDKDHLNVAFLIPFNYYKKPVPDSVLLEQKEKDKDKPADLLPKSTNYLEFFNGSLMAIRQLQKEGINCHLTFYDTRMSPDRVREIISSQDFENTDLIIGPFYGWNVEIVAEYSRDKGVPLVSPFYENGELTSANPFLFQLNPSYKIEYRTAASILADDYDKNIIFAYRPDSLKMHEIDYFKTSLVNSVSSKFPEENLVIKEMVYDNIAKARLSQDFKLALSTEKTNLVIIPETDEAFVSSIIQQLYFLCELEGYDIEVFGMPHFAQFENVEYKYYFDLKLRYITPYHYSHKDSIMNHFLEDYRSYFRVEPSKLTLKGYPYAVAGHDITYFFIKSMTSNGRRFVKYLNREYSDDLLIPFRWKKQSGYAGFENYHLTLVEFSDGFSFAHRDVTNIPFRRIEERSPWYMRFDD